MPENQPHADYSEDKLSIRISAAGNTPTTIPAWKFIDLYTFVMPI